MPRTARNASRSRRVSRMATGSLSTASSRPATRSSCGERTSCGAMSRCRWAGYSIRNRRWRGNKRRHGCRGGPHEGPPPAPIAQAFLKRPSARSRKISSAAPATPTISWMTIPPPASPSLPASQNPSADPTIPTRILAIRPICASAFMRMLASQPTIPPITRDQIMLLPLVVCGCTSRPEWMRRCAGTLADQTVEGIEANAWSEPPGAGGTERPRLDGMKMQVLDRGGLARQPGFVKIRDIVAIVVEQIENRQQNVEIVPEVKASFDIHQRRGPGGDAAVLDQRRLAEVADTGAAVPTAWPLECQAERSHLLDRPGDVIAGRIVAREARMRQGQIQIHDQPV